MLAGMAGRIVPMPDVSGMGNGAAGRTAAAACAEEEEEEEEEERGGGRDGGLRIPEFQGATTFTFFAALFDSLDVERCRCCCLIMDGGLIVGAGVGTGSGRAIAPAPGGGGGGCGG